jgi:hypothetical protein
MLKSSNFFYTYLKGISELQGRQVTRRASEDLQDRSRTTFRETTVMISNGSSAGSMKLSGRKPWDQGSRRKNTLLMNLFCYEAS